MASPLPLRILVQVGHESPREPGFERGTGAAGELELNQRLGAALLRRLQPDSRFVARKISGAIPADVKSGAWKVDAFISLHCDGSGNRDRDGWCFGYPRDLGSNKRLADTIAGEFAGFHRSSRGRDNYTTDLSGYYGWKRVPTTGPEVLVEHGFVSNPSERTWIGENVERLAEAEYRALVKYFRLSDDGEGDGELVALGSWFPEWALWVTGRGRYEQHGRANKKVRPRAAPARIPKIAWVVLQQLRRRDEEHEPPG